MQKSSNKLRDSPYVVLKKKTFLFFPSTISGWSDILIDRRQINSQKISLTMYVLESHKNMKFSGNQQLMYHPEPRKKGDRVLGLQKEEEK